MPRPIVLVADDDLPLLKAIGLRLEASGFEVCLAQDGYMAVQSARRLHPDVMLLDVGMPAGDGFSVHERVCQLGAADGVEPPQVVYFSGSETAARSEQRRRAYAFVRKPFDGPALAAIVKGAANKRRELMLARSLRPSELQFDWATD
jgi:DNA-binding response OmpR family regulator